MSPTFRTIPFGSPAYNEECRLRDCVLRQPLGMNLFNEDLTEEVDQLHFGLFHSDDSLIACVIAVPGTAQDVKLRQMAVASDHLRKGYGTILLRHVEANLSDLRFISCRLHARATAVPFYHKCGYVERGPMFVEIGIPHVQMEKQIKH